MDIDLSTSVNTDRTINEFADETERISPAQPAWHRPRVTRIEIKRTMFNTGSPSDGGSSGSTPG
jgi:hypothetical protein